MAKDMYADLEKIEARGKRKKEKSKGLFSSFGKKDEPEPEESPEESPEGAPEPEQPEPAPAQPEQMKAPEPAPAPEPDAPARQPAPAPQQRPAEPPPHPSGWQPLNGARLRKAQDELLEYKKWLNKGYKSGMLTKEQCVDMVRKKEIELGLRPPE